MIAYLVLLFAALSRFFPHAFHGVGLNLTAVSGGLLFFGSRRPRREAAAAVLVLALTDVYLTRMVYGFPFHLTAYLPTWTWYAAVSLLGAGLLSRVTVLRVVAAVLASATGFFLLSNAVVWAGGGMYPHNAGGLLTCYEAALPFYGNDLVSTALTCGMLFGLPVLARSLHRMIEVAHQGNQPLA